MRNDERELPLDPVPPDDDLRYAPPEVQDSEPVSDDADAAVDDSPAALTASDEDALETLRLFPPEPSDVMPGDLDIEAALAAVSSISDMLAEKEAEELAEVERAEAARQAAAERQARLEHPERFFPVPPQTTLHRGQMASVIPALVLIGLGAWLTFTLTTSKAAPDPALMIGALAGGAALMLLSRWLTAGRWARGALFFALALLFGGGTILFLAQPASPGLGRGWPLLVAALGLAIMLTGILAQPSDRRLLWPGLLLVAAGGAGLAVTLNLLNSDLLNLAATWWPVPVVLLLFLLLLPLVARRRA
jgi:hypothetical protein